MAFADGFCGLFIMLVLSILSFYIGCEYAKTSVSVVLDCPDHPPVEVIFEETPVKCEAKKVVSVKCPRESPKSTYYMHKNYIGPIENYVSGYKGPPGQSVLNIAFDNLRHPGSPLKSEFVLSQAKKWSHTQPFLDCKDIVLTRTGSRENTPCKCVAVAIVPEEFVSHQFQSNRVGYSARLTNQYQNDYIRHVNMLDEPLLLLPLIRDRKVLVKELLRVLGDPIRADGSRRTATVMVANEGVMDLVLNFVCSARTSGIDLDGVVVFVGHPEHIPLLDAMGVKGMYHPSLGTMPKKAAGNYADSIFTRLMWLKVTSVYLSLTAGFDVLFQDADLVWMRDPRPLLQSMTGSDAVFMDDGARTPRFTPFFANTGFYFLRHNWRVLHMMERVVNGVGEIAFTHSHQSTLNRHLTETQSLLNLQINVLSSIDFPSGIMFHHNKTFMQRLREHQEQPYVFHMCWTDNREQKVFYFKQIGMWFIPDDKPTCQDGRLMLQSVLDPKAGANAEGGLLSAWIRRGKDRDSGAAPRTSSNATAADIASRCCLVAPHWAVPLSER